MVLDKTPFHVVVKQEHINAGAKCEPGNCPVALAWRDTFPDMHEVGVVGRIKGQNSMGLDIRVGERNFYFDSKTNDAVNDFDDKGVMEPFEFDAYETGPLASYRGAYYEELFS